ncbi:MAG: hypothetical protein GF334_11065, partial [Candidatus Altiarchaeales archaeon]|nr:hypothetical protein [Candidatus Altiarchaeales archaeon]
MSVNSGSARVRLGEILNGLLNMENIIGQYRNAAYMIDPEAIYRYPADEDAISWVLVQFLGGEVYNSYDGGLHLPVFEFEVLAASHPIHYTPYTLQPDEILNTKVVKFEELPLYVGAVVVTDAFNELLED